MLFQNDKTRKFSKSQNKHLFRFPYEKSSKIFSRIKQVFPSLAPDAPPEEELTVRETRYWGVLKSGHTRFMVPLCERRDVLSAADYMILFQNLDELLKLSEEIRDEGGGIDSYLCRVPKITAAYRRYLSGLQRACCLLVALRRNTAFAKLVCEPAVPHKRRPDLTGVLLLPLEHYRLDTTLYKVFLFACRSFLFDKNHIFAQKNFWNKID